MRCIHLLVMGSCRCKSPCGSLPHSAPLGHKRGWYTASHIPSCPMRGLGSHTSHCQSSPHEIDNQPPCKKHRGCLASQEGIHRFPCVFEACTLLCFHKLWVGKGPHIRWTCKSCQRDNPHLFDIALRGKRSWKNLPKCPTFSTKHWTYIGNIPGVDFLPSSLGICRLGYDWMFDRWHSCRRGLFHKGQHSSFLCKPCHWDTHHHAGIPLFWLWKKEQTKYKFLANSKEVSLTVLLTYFAHIAWKDPL